MKESTSLRAIFVGVCLIGLGLLLPDGTPNVLRALPVVLGSVLSVAASWMLIKKPREAPDEEHRSPDLSDDTDV